MKNITSQKICIIALCAVFNFVGGSIALMLRLPIYLDTIGTVLAAAILGPVYGMLPGLITGLISGFTTDIYSLYYIPVQLITGLIAGLLFKKNMFKKWMLPFGTLLLTVPGTIVSSMITAFCFGGITSSGSSIIVMLLNKLGFNMTASVFVVQIITDYADRLCAVFITCACLAFLPAQFKSFSKGASLNGSL